MKVVIADDEMLVRISLRSMIEEMESRWNILGEATNGAELVELLRSYKPDIVLIDIRMPLMNGLQAILEGTTLSPHTRYIIISGYSDFTYAQEALKLGTADYLLKPVSPEDLEASLLKASQRVKEQKGWLNRQFEADLFSLFNGISPPGSELDGDYLAAVCCRGMVFYTDSVLSESLKAEKQRALCQAIRHKADTQGRDSLVQALFVLPEGELAFVAAWDRDKSPQGEEEAGLLLQQLQEAASSLRYIDFAVTTIVTKPCEGIMDLQRQRSRLHKLAPLRALLGINASFTLGELEAFEHQREYYDIAQVAAQLYQSYRDKDYMLFMKALGILEKEGAALDELIRPLYKRGLSRYLSSLLDCQLGPELRIPAWIAPLYATSERILTELNAGVGDQASCLVKSAISFIEQNYAQDISIMQIAKELRVTHNYLSTLFHKKTGTTFLKYLTRIRMIKAKELLAVPNIQVQQAAEQVGYYSTRHFTRLFTEFTGCYPSEYKKRFV